MAFVLNAILWWLTGDFSSSLNYLPFFAIGVMASEFSMIKLLTNRYLTLFALPVIFLLTSFWSSGGMSVGNFAIKIVVALSVIPIVYYICAEMEWNPYMDRFMTMCGVNSLAIYCVHRYFTIIWLSEYHFVENEFLALLYTSILAIILCYICVFIKKVIRNYSFVNFLLFGSNK